MPSEYLEKSRADARGRCYQGNELSVLICGLSGRTLCTCRYTLKVMEKKTYLLVNTVRVSHDAPRAMQGVDERYPGVLIIKQLIDDPEKETIQGMK